MDALVKDGREQEFMKILKLMQDGIKNGVVKPLDRTIFQRDEVEKAFRYMAAGTHIGKVLIKVCGLDHLQFGACSYSSK